MNRTARFLAAAVVVTLVGCGDATSTRMSGVTVDTLPSGTVRVSNPESGQWDQSSWRLVEDLRIGAVDGPATDVFGRIASFAVDRSGRIWILDGQARELRVFDSDGRYLRTVGRAGGGPGEFSRPHAVHAHPDGTMWVVDPGARRYSAFDTSGAFVTSHGRELQSSVPSRSEGFDSQGRLVELVGGFKDNALEYSLVRLRPEEGVIEDTLDIPPYQEEQFEAVVPQEGGSARYTSRVPFTPYLTWTSDSRGYLWHSLTAPYRIYKQSFAGDTAQVIEREYAPVQVSSEERRQEIEDLARFREMGASISSSRIPSEKPALEFVFVDDAGFLWVQPVLPDQPTSDGAVLTAFDLN